MNLAYRDLECRSTRSGILCALRSSMVTDGWYLIRKEVLNKRRGGTFGKVFSLGWISRLVDRDGAFACPQEIVSKFKVLNTMKFFFCGCVTYVCVELVFSHVFEILHRNKGGKE